MRKTAKKMKKLPAEPGFRPIWAKTSLRRSWDPQDAPKVEFSVPEAPKIEFSASWAPPNPFFGSRGQKVGKTAHIGEKPPVFFISRGPGEPKATKDFPRVVARLEWRLGRAVFPLLRVRTVSESSNLSFRPLRSPFSAILALETRFRGSWG